MRLTGHIVCIPYVPGRILIRLLEKRRKKLVKFLANEKSYPVCENGNTVMHGQLKITVLSPVICGGELFVQEVWLLLCP